MQKSNWKNQNYISKRQIWQLLFSSRQWRQGSILMTSAGSSRNHLKLILVPSAYTSTCLKQYSGRFLNASGIVSRIPFRVFHWHFSSCDLIFELAALPRLELSKLAL